MRMLNSLTPPSLDLTCRDDVEGAGLRLLSQLIGRPAEDGAVVQLVEGRVNQLGQGPVLTEAGVLHRKIHHRGV